MIRFTIAVLALLICSHSVIVDVMTSPVGSNLADATTNTIADESDECAIPSDDELVRIFTGSETFMAYIPDDESGSHNAKVNGSVPDEPSASSANGLHCPVGEKITESSPVRFRGVCPWELLDDFDSNRYPKIIQKAVCRCTNCLDPKTNQPNDKLSCEPVYYPMPVLRRTGCRDGVATFEPIYEHVPVACDCILRKRTTVDNGIPTMTM